MDKSQKYSYGFCNLTVYDTDAKWYDNMQTNKIEIKTKVEDCLLGQAKDQPTRCDIMKGQRAGIVFPSVIHANSWLNVSCIITPPPFSALPLFFFFFDFYVVHYYRSQFFWKKIN